MKITTPNKMHARLSASGAHRWMSCPGSVRLEAEFPESTSEYAEEGTLAHEFVELQLKLCCKSITKEQYEAKIAELQTQKYYSKEMETYAYEYASEVFNLGSELFVVSETRVDFSDYVKDGFGTADTLAVDGEHLFVIDYKYGKGVMVDAYNNPQLRLYALGAYEQFRLIYDIKDVTMIIIQPRMDHISKQTITLEALLAFGETVKEKALATEAPDAPCKCGEWCKFCKAKAVCRARADEAISLAGFTNIAPDTLLEAEIGLYLQKGQIVADWLKDLQEYAFKLLNEGKKVTGFKLVEGRSIRKWTNEGEAFQYIISNNLLPEAMLYEKKAVSLAQVEKMLGKAKFAPLADFVTKPQGQPTMVAESDKRPEYKLNLKEIFK